MATSRLALPLMIIYSIVIWAAYIAADITLWPCLVIYVISTYLMVELNNRNTLMRQYSRMVSCSYMAMMLMCPWIMLSISTMAAQCCIIMVFTLLFMTYQDRSALGRKYWAYLFLGIACTIWSPLIYFLPLFWIGEASYLMSFSMRSWFASIFGVLTPLWVLAPIQMYTGDYNWLWAMADNFVPSEKTLSSFHDVSSFLPHELPLPAESICIIVFVIILMLTGLIHYFRQSYTDKIQVRMLYQFFSLIAIASTVVLVLMAILPCETQPAVDILYATMLVCTAPLLAHYVTFSSSRLTNISVIIIMLIVFGVSAYQAATDILQSFQISINL